MAHFLYRPHIRHPATNAGYKVVTTDFIIRSCELYPAAGSGKAGLALPADMLNTSVTLEARANESLVAPVVFTFAGDDTRFAAPGLALLDARVHTADPQLAWQMARVSVARTALDLGGHNTMTIRLDGETSATLKCEDMRGAARHHAAIYSAGEIRRLLLPSHLSIVIGALPEAEHYIALRALSEEQAA